MLKCLKTPRDWNLFIKTFTEFKPENFATHNRSPPYCLSICIPVNMVFSVADASPTHFAGLVQMVRSNTPRSPSVFSLLLMNHLFFHSFAPFSAPLLRTMLQTEKSSTSEWSPKCRIISSWFISACLWVENP